MVTSGTGYEKEWHDAVAENARLRGDLEQARRVLVFADGVALSQTGYTLADLYAEDYAPAQQALKAAGCHPRKVSGGESSPAERNE